jgi:predicted ATPase
LLKIDSRRPRPALLVPPPDIRSPLAPFHSLPVALTSFVGRSSEQAAIAQLLTTTRLLTLTGAAGSGKTRLALAAAQELGPAYRDGVALVELADLSDAARAPQAIADALGLNVEPQRPIMAALAEALRCSELLLVLDNCERLIDACARLAQALLAACPRLRILATSREALGIAGETVWVAPPLALPDPQHLHENNSELVSMLMQSEAIALFVERATAARPSFRLTPRNALAVAQICRRLDGLPLAIELAAARVKLLAPAQIAARLDDCLQLLSAGRAAHPRHQSLRAAIDWSYELLSEQERAELRRLAVFEGGWDLEAAEAVCGVLSFEF